MNAPDFVTFYPRLAAELWQIELDAMPGWVDTPRGLRPAAHVLPEVTFATVLFTALTVWLVLGLTRWDWAVWVWIPQDWTPIYDRTELPGFYVAMGTSGNQFKNAPVVGRMMATLIEQVEAGVDHDGQPVQYKGTHTGLRIDLGVFSRKRDRNTGSSGTVMG